MKLKIKSLVNKLKVKHQQNKAQKALKNKRCIYCQEFSKEFGSLDSTPEDYIDYPIIPDKRRTFSPRFTIGDDFCDEDN